MQFSLKSSYTEKELLALRHNLEGLENVARLAFAARCAWRAAPWMARRWERNKDSPSEKAFGKNFLINRAALAVAILIPRSGQDSERYSIAYAKVVGTHAIDDAAGYAASAAGYSDNCSGTVCSAAWAASLAPDTDFDSFAIKMAAQHDIACLQSGLNTPDLLDSPLWPESENSWNRLESLWRKIHAELPETIGNFWEVISEMSYGRASWEKIDRYYEQGVECLMAFRN